MVYTYPQESPEFYIDLVRITNLIIGNNKTILNRLDVDTKLSDRLTLTYFSCRTEEKIAALLCLLKWIIDSHEQTMIFAATKHHVELLHWVRSLKHYADYAGTLF